MVNTVIINGSPRKARGYTAMVLEPFIKGMQSAGAKIDLFYASDLKVTPCDCGILYCWNKVPGECIHKDSMQALYAKLKEAHTVVFATPVYIPLPGDLQNILNRLCPLLDPILSYHNGRTRAKLRADYEIQRFALVSIGGWWEVETMDTVVRIIQEFADVASTGFAGAVRRPHAYSMKRKGIFTEDGMKIIHDLEIAGQELIENGVIPEELLERISRQLISQEDSM